MKKDWDIKTLQDVCSMKITDGTHQTPRYCNENEGGFPFISAKNVTKGIIDWDDIKYIVPELHEELYKRIAPQRDDILLAKNGTTGVAAIVDVDKIFDIYVTLAVLRPNKKLIYPKYLLHIVNSNYCKVQFDAHLKGIGVPNLHLVEIQQVHIPVPPLEEQKRIVKILDEKFAQLETIKAASQTNLQNAKDLFQAELTSIYNSNYPFVKVGEIATIKGGKRIPKGRKLITENTGHPYIRVTDFTDNGSVSLDDIRYVTEDIYQIIKRYTITTDDVFISIAGTIGKVGIVPTELNNANLTENACKLILKENIFNKFIVYLFLSDEVKKITQENARANAMPKLSILRLSEIEIPLPPLPEQKRIVKELDTLSEKVRQLQEIYTKQIANCDELKQSYLQKAFEGEL